MPRLRSIAKKRAGLPMPATACTRLPAKSSSGSGRPPSSGTAVPEDWRISHSPKPGSVSPTVSLSTWKSHDAARGTGSRRGRSEEHTSELQSLMRISYAVFCLKKKNRTVLHEDQHYCNQAHICNLYSINIL